jgi:hypothetical protein
MYRRPTTKVFIVLEFNENQRRARGKLDEAGTRDNFGDLGHRRRPVQSPAEWQIGRVPRRTDGPARSLDLGVLEKSTFARPV